MVINQLLAGCNHLRIFTPPRLRDHGDYIVVQPQQAMTGITQVDV